MGEAEPSADRKHLSALVDVQVAGRPVHGSQIGVDRGEPAAEHLLFSRV
jgi:hypothetical protein